MGNDFIKVLIVDDSSVARKFIASALDKNPLIKVVGQAENGKEGVELMQKLKPDVITLDVEMPVMDGLQTLGQIRRWDKKVPVIMFSTLTEKGARVTFEALTLGASDYVAKPSSLGGRKNAAVEVCEEILEKVMAHARNSSPVAPSRPTAPPPSAVAVSPNTSVLDSDRSAAAPLAVKGLAYTLRPSRKRSTPFKVVGIGISTGGPNALASLLTDLRGPMPVPIVITQHMPPIFTTILAERLKKVSGLEVIEAFDGQQLLPGEIYLAPGGFHMDIVSKGSDGFITLNQNPAENSCRPSVDVMFRALAREYGGDVLAVMLTGIGSDGLKGSELIVDKGGEIIVQDEDSSAVWGMPGTVVQAGLASAIYPLRSMALAIRQRLNVK